MKTLQHHKNDVEKIAQRIKDYSESDHSKKLRFFHGGTNSTRTQDSKDYFFIDISHLDHVIEVNTKEKYVLVEPNVSMDKLVTTTMQYGLTPPVVMELPGITAGGAVNGATIESSSFRRGQLSDECEEYEIILGNGEIVTANREKHDDLFYGISGTYGTIGLLTLIKICLVNATKYVKVAFYPVKTYKDSLTLLEEKMHDEEIDYIDSIIFSPTQSVIMCGKRVDHAELPIHTYSKATDPWFYERAREASNKQEVYEELIPLHEYEFRYNRGTFWMGEFLFPLLHIPKNKFTRRVVNPFINTRKLYDGLHACNISQEFFMQDFYCPIETTLQFLEYSEKNLDIFPIWLCPMKPTTTPQKISPHYLKSKMLIDIGIWGQSKQYLKDNIGVNKEFETLAKKLGGRKMLYAHAYYTEDEFWKVYDKEWYEKLREKYHANKIFPTVWQKVYVSGEYSPHFLKGLWQIFCETIQGKHLNT